MGSRVNNGGGGIFFSSMNYLNENFTLKLFNAKKSLGLTSRGNFVYHIIIVSKANILNLRPLGPLLCVEKFVWMGGWWVVCKVILVFRFGPELGHKWKTWAKLNNKRYFFISKTFELEDFG